MADRTRATVRRPTNRPSVRSCGRRKARAFVSGDMGNAGVQDGPRRSGRRRDSLRHGRRNCRLPLVASHVHQQSRHGRSSPESCSTTREAFDHNANDGSLQPLGTDRHDRRTGIAPDDHGSRSNGDASNWNDRRRSGFKLARKLCTPCRNPPFSAVNNCLIGHYERGFIHQ